MATDFHAVLTATIGGDTYALEWTEGELREDWGLTGSKRPRVVITGEYRRVHPVETQRRAPEPTLRVHVWPDGRIIVAMNENISGAALGHLRDAINEELPDWRAGLKALVFPDAVVIAEPSGTK